MENTIVKETNKEVHKVKEIDKYQGVYLLKPAKKTYLAEMNPRHDGAVIFSGAADYVAPQRHSSTGLILTGLTDGEARELEVEMGYKPMTLSPYNQAFWADYKLYPKVTKEGVTLDLSRSALDKLRYLYCKAHSEVAQSYADALENPRAKWVLVSQEKEAKTESSKIRTKMEAMKRLGELTLNEQMDFLKVFEGGKFRVTKGSSADFILSTAGKVAEETPEAFIALLDNPDFKNMIFLQDCVQIGLIKKSGPKYYVVGGDLLGNTFLDSITNLAKPEYNELKVSLKAKIQSTKS